MVSFCSSNQHHNAADSIIEIGGNYTVAGPEEIGRKYLWWINSLPSEEDHFYQDHIKCNASSMRLRYISEWYYYILSIYIIVVLRSDSVVIIVVPTGKYPTLTLTLTCGGYCYYFPNTPLRWFPLISSDSWNISTPSLDVHIENFAKNVCKRKGGTEKWIKLSELWVSFSLF